MKHYLKIENNTIVQAEFCVKKSDYTIYGYNAESNEKMLFQDGYSTFPHSKYFYEIKDGIITDKETEQLQ